MRTQSEATNIYPNQIHTDVLVCGGGPAGMGAAVASARNGAKTLLVEHFGCLGGQATAGLVLTWGDIHVPVAREIFGRMQESGTVRGITFEPEAFKLEANKTVLDAGVEILFHTTAFEAIVDGEAIKGVIAGNKSGLFRIMAQVVIDCTGDGDIAADAGAPYTVGRDQDGLMQPVTLMFRAGNVDIERYDTYRQRDRRLEQALQAAIDAGEMAPFAVTLMSSSQIPGRNELMVNITNLTRIDGTDPYDLTRAEIETRQQVWKVMEVLRKRVPGCESAHIVDTAAIVGVRETRHIVGEYLYRREDVLEARKFEDRVARNTYEIDIHPVDGVGRARHEWGKLSTAEQRWSDIPYGCLVPLKVDNLLVAGRCCSADHEALGAMRRMGPCMFTGYAAGTAATLSIQQGTTVRCLRVSDLQQRMRQNGVKI